MNIAPNRLGQPAATAEAILEALFHPTGVDGVYGRSGAYEAVVEGLGALINDAARPARRNRALPAGREPRADREIRLSEELSASARLRLRARRRRRRDRRGGRPLRDGRDLDRRPSGKRPRARRRRPATRSIRWRRGAGRSRATGCIFDVASDCFRREPSRDIDRLQSFRMREFVFIGAPERRRRSATIGRRAPATSPTRSASRRASRRRAIRSSAAAARWSAASRSSRR